MEMEDKENGEDATVWNEAMNNGMLDITEYCTQYYGVWYSASLIQATSTDKYSVEVGGELEVCTSTDEHH